MGNNKRHPLYHQDESKANCVYLAIEDHQLDVVDAIVDKVDVFTLNTMPIVDNKIALKYVQEKVKKGFVEFEELSKALQRKKDLKRRQSLKTASVSDDVILSTPCQLENNLQSPTTSQHNNDIFPLAWSAAVVPLQ